MGTKNFNKAAAEAACSKNNFKAKKALKKAATSRNNKLRKLVNGLVAVGGIVVTIAVAVLTIREIIKDFKKD